MSRWYVSGTLMEYILTVNVVCATEAEALVAWSAAFPADDLKSWHVTATNVDLATGTQRALLDDLWCGHGTQNVSGGYNYGV